MSSASASAPAHSRRGALFVEYMHRMAAAVPRGDGALKAADADAATTAANRHALHLMVQMIADDSEAVVDGAAAPAASAISPSWDVLQTLVAEVASRVQQLRAHGAQSLALVESADAAPRAATSSRKPKQQQPSKGSKGGGGGGGPLPASQSLALDRQRESLQLQRQLGLFLLATEVLARWMVDQSVRAASPDQTAAAVLQGLVDQGMQLVQGAEFASIHAATVAAVFQLTRLDRQIQHKLQSSLLEALGSGTAASASSSASSSALPLQPRPLCLLLQSLEQSGDAAFSDQVWTAALHCMQSSPSVQLRQQVLRLLLPTLLQPALPNHVARTQELSASMRSLWSRALQATGHPTDGSTAITRLSPFAPSPFLESGFLESLILAQPPLAHLFDVLCSFAGPMLTTAAAGADGAVGSLDAWLMEVVLSGLASGHVVFKKQAMFILAIRLAVKEEAAAAAAAGGEDGGAAAAQKAPQDDYSLEQWSCFRQLIQTLEGTSLHLVQSVYPRISQLFAAPRCMDAWLELLVRQSCLHPQPSVASTCFQQLYALCQPAANAAPAPPRFRPAVVLGPILLYFDEPSLFGVDKERAGTRRLGDTLLAPFLRGYIEALPASAIVDPLTSQRCASRQEFMQRFIAWLCPARASSSIGALSMQMRALAECASPPRCLLEADVVVLLALMQGRLSSASSRLRPMLTVSMLQVLARHVDLACNVAPALIARLLQEFPVAWMRTNCASLQLLQRTFGRTEAAGEAEGGWVARTLLAYFDGFFAQLQASASGVATAAPAAAASSSSSTEAPMLLSQGADMSSMHEGLYRLLMLVEDGSAFESVLLSRLSSRITACLQALYAAPPSFVATQALLQLLHFIAGFLRVFSASRTHGLEARRSSEHRFWLETIAVPEECSSQRFLEDQASFSSSSSSVSSSVAVDESAAWERRLVWASALVSQHGVQWVDALHTLVSAQLSPAEDGSSSAAGSSAEASLGLSTSLVSVLSLLLSHSSLRAYRLRLLSVLVGLVVRLDSAGAVSSTDRTVLYGLLFATVTNCTQEDWDAVDAAAASSSSSPSVADDAADRATVASWLAALASSASASPSLLPSALTRFLTRHFVHATLPRKPAGLSAASWKAAVQRFHLHRWSCVRVLLDVAARAGWALAPMLEAAVDQLDGATEVFLEAVLHAIRILLPQSLQQCGESSGVQVDLVSRTYRAAWNAFRDVQQDLPSFTGVLAFLALIFSPCVLRLEAMHDGCSEGGQAVAAAAAPFRSMFATLLAYGLGHSRFQVYLTFFALEAYTRLPLLMLPRYCPELLGLALYRAEGASEVERIEEKMSAWETAHMIHNFSEVAVGASVAPAAEARSIVAHDGLQRGESIVRCASLHFLQQLPALYSAPSSCAAIQSVLRSFLFDFATRLVSHADMASDKGSMLGEGNDDFVAKVYLWQTACVITGALRCMPRGAERERMLDLISAHTWAWFERSLTSVLRQLLEVCLVNLYAQAPERIGREVGGAIDKHLARPTLLASSVLILAFATLGIEDASARSAQAPRTLRLLHPYLGCNFGHVRLVVQYLYHRLVVQLGPREWQPLATLAACGNNGSVAPGADEESSAIQRTVSYLHADPDLTRLRSRQDQYFTAFSPLASGCTVQGLLANGDEAHHFLSRALMDLIAGVQGEYLTSLRAGYDDLLQLQQAEAAANAAAAATAVSAAASNNASAAAASSSPSSSSGGVNFQQKIEVTSLTQLTALGDLVSGAGSGSSAGGAESEHAVEDDASVSLRSAVESRTSAPRQDLIVIASLVSKLPNLAGLSRTCEIFSAQRLMMRDPAIVAERDFQNISVTAHRWLTIEALEPANIAAFIRERQSEGYVCIALEQSAASIPLPSFQFPSRCVILLGAEKEGVPVDLLNLVDRCVEIPQTGIIRSLNVHVSASILLWEYTRQRMLGIVDTA